MTKKDKEKLIEAVKEAKTAEEKVSKGAKQAMDISKMYEVFNDIQREAFLLGRISALLEFGNSISDAANLNIHNCEEVLKNVRERINQAQSDMKVEYSEFKSKEEMKKPARKPRTKKKEVKDE